MERIFVTILEPTLERALEAIAELPAGRFGIELRADRLAAQPSESALYSFRQRVPRPLLYTRRSPYGGTAADPLEILRAARVGFDHIDHEVDPTAPAMSGALESIRDRLLFSIHDFEGVPDVERIGRHMSSLGRFKIAATPRTFADDARLLREQRRYGSGASIFGMGSRGLYSRVLSPFFGGAPTFVSPSADRPAAPGQLSLLRALAILGEPQPPPPDHLFGIVGWPVAHSRSPEIHNAIFRRERVAAAYGFLETESVAEIFDAMVDGEEFSPTGISITTPFKREALDIARARGVSISSRAERADAINTLIRSTNGSLHADNTDVAGFTSLLESMFVRSDGRPLLVVGAGATGRAATVAACDLGIPVVITNRTPARARELARDLGLSAMDWDSMFDCDPSAIVDTLPAAAGWSIAPQTALRLRGLISTDYSGGAREDHHALRRAGVRVADGLDLLRAQAAEQSRQFLLAMDPSRSDRAIPDVPEVET